MAALDLFGLGKDKESSAGNAQEPPAEPAKPVSRKTWSRLLLLNFLFLAGFGAGFSMRMKSLLPPEIPLPPQRPAPRPSAAEPPGPPKAQEPKPAPAGPAATAPQKEESKPSPTAPKEKGPIGSPSVNAPDLPARGTPELEAAQPAPKPKPAPAKPGKVRPVDFTYNDPAAKEVYLLGPFLVRTGGRKPLAKDASGTWRLTIYLNSTTTYQYHFEVVDGQGRRAATAKQSLDVP